MMAWRWLPKVRRVLWALFWLALPVSSFPFFPGFMGKTVLVRPLALYPLLLLLVVSVLPAILTRPVPRTWLPFGTFVLAALVSTAFAFSRGSSPVLEDELVGRTVRTLATLAFGGLFYLTVSLVPHSQSELRSTLIWLYAGFAIALLWASLQIIYVVHFSQPFFDFLSEMQSLVSIRRLFDKRISGLTYEPSWFAEQLTLILMPWLFSSLITKVSVFQWRWRGLTVEAILLGWSALALLFTYSRGGVALFAILVSLSLFIGLRRRYQDAHGHSPPTGRMVLLISLVLVLLCLVVFVAAQNNNYFSRLWGYWTDEESEGPYLTYIAFSQRFVHWETAYRIFEHYPVLGIGLGNYTFYFDQYLPERPIRDPEILMKLVPEKGRNQIVTVKNYLVRILAETGIVGLSAYLVFLTAVTGCAIYLWFSPQEESQFWGLAGLLGLVAFIPAALSVDSFAIPNSWVVFGLITAGAHVYPVTERPEGVDI
jgi:hypothetical protein